MDKKQIGRYAFYSFLAVSLVHLAGQIAVPGTILPEATQVLLMMALAVVLWATAGPSRLRTIALAALFFSWLGDTVPRFVDGDAGFLAMLGFFLVSQVTYAGAFYPYRGRSILRTPILIAPYVLSAIGLIVWCAGGAGSMLPAVIAYAGVIVIMAVLATGLGAVATMGGVLFLVSDALIALRAFADVQLGIHGFWVMATYIAAQALLAYGIVAQSYRDQGRPARSS